MSGDGEPGARYIRQTLAAIEEMRASAEDKHRMLRGNALRLLGLEASK